MSRKPRLWMAPFLALLLLGCGGEGADGDAKPEIHLEGSWARAMPLVSGEGEAATNSAVYLSIRNDGSAGDRLTGATSDVAERVEIHESKIKNDMMAMEELESIEIPAGGSVELKPGGIHVMLLGIRKSLVVGQDFDLVLHFQKTGDLSVTVPVRLNAEG